MRLFAAFLILSATALAYTGSSPTLTTDGSQSDVAAAIAAAVDGDTIIIPAGTFTWTSGITISGKGIHLQGAGAGRVVARSSSSVSVGTGTKTFTVIRDETSQTAYSFVNGETLTIERMATPHTAGTPTGTRTSMTGTVTSFNSGTGELVMDISGTAGSGTHPQWIVSTPATTTISKNITDGVMIAITEDTTHHVEISGIRQTWTGGIGNVITITGTTGGKIVKIRDCYFETVERGGYINIYTVAKGGLIYNCSFAGYPVTGELNGDQCIQSRRSEDTWVLASTMGTDDTDGTNNLYIENCDFHGIQNVTDLDNNTKAVIRYSLFNHSGIGTHGADSSNYGLRHVEIYNNKFTMTGYGDGNTSNLNYYMYFRGGTGVIYNNDITDISSSDYGDKGEIGLQIQQLGINRGPNGNWSDNDGQVPERHVPRQVGYGRVTGSGLDGLGRSTDSITYVGDIEPLYIWGNTGTYTVGVNTGWESLAGTGGLYAVDPDLASDYIRAGTEYYNNGTAKPGWTAYTYPHPLREATGTATISGTLTVTGTITLQ